MLGFSKRPRWLPCTYIVTIYRWYKKYHQLEERKYHGIYGRIRASELRFLWEKWANQRICCKAKEDYLYKILNLGKYKQSYTSFPVSNAFVRLEFLHERTTPQWLYHCQGSSITWPKESSALRLVIKILLERCLFLVGCYDSYLIPSVAHFRGPVDHCQVTFSTTQGYDGVDHCQVTFSTTQGYHGVDHCQVTFSTTQGYDGVDHHQVTFSTTQGCNGSVMHVSIGVKQPQTLVPEPPRQPKSCNRTHFEAILSCAKSLSRQLCTRSRF